MPSNRNCPLFLQYVVKLLPCLHQLAEQPVDADAATATNRAEMDRQRRNQAEGNATATETTILQLPEDVEANLATPYSEDGNAEEEAATAMKTGLKIAISVTLTAAAGLIAILAGFVGNNKKTSITHKLFFNASIICMCATFLFGCFVILLAVFRASMPCLRLSTIVRSLVLAAIISLALVVGFGATFYFNRDG